VDKFLAFLVLYTSEVVVWISITRRIITIQVYSVIPNRFIAIHDAPLLFKGLIAQPTDGYFPGRSSLMINGRALRLKYHIDDKSICLAWRAFTFSLVYCIREGDGTSRLAAGCVLHWTVDPKGKNENEEQGYLSRFSLTSRFTPSRNHEIIDVL
jgi:hypothetical protein